jgi:hypothetical protein
MGNHDLSSNIWRKENGNNVKCTSQEVVKVVSLNVKDDNT